MKKTIILVTGFIFLIVSCKKTRICTCNITQTTNSTISYNNGAASTSSITIADSTDVKSNNYITLGTAYQVFNCHNRNEKYTYSKSVYSGTLTTTTTNDHSDEYKCALK